MAYLDGTRSATAQCDLSLSYNILVYPNDLFPFVAAKLGYVDGSIGGPGSHTGAYSTWTWSWTSTPHAPNWQWFIYLTMTSNDGYGHSTTVVKTVASGTESFATEWVDVAATQDQAHLAAGEALRVLEHGGQSGAGADAEQAGLDQGMAEQGLQPESGKRQRGAGHQRQQETRQTQLPDDVRRLRPGRQAGPERPGGQAGRQREKQDALQESRARRVKA